VPHPPDRPSALPAGGDNAVAYAIGVTADEWTLLIIRQALHGARRYNDWQRAMPISHAVLTSRLRRLEELGMLVAVPYQDRPRRLEYHLTPRGLGIWPVLVGIWAWEAHWVSGGLVIRDVHCGQLTLPLMACGRCRAVVRTRDVRGDFGPSGSWPRSVPHATNRRRSRGGNGTPGLLPETTALVGNRWSAALLGAALFGAHRFGEFQSRMGAPASIVSDRLRTFCERGVLTATADEQRADRSLYHLTTKGRAFFPVVLCAIHWAQQWFQAPEGPAMEFRHDDHPFTPVPLCDQCRVPLNRADTVIESAVRATNGRTGTVLRP
jgi:DNA-binding HxlR family transcriptional regulator